MDFNNYEDLAFPGESYRQKVSELREAYGPRRNDADAEDAKKEHKFDLRALLASLFV